MFFCLSGSKFEKCCNLALEKKKTDNYIPFLKAIIKSEKYKDYLQFSSKLFEKIYIKLAKNEKCNLPYCENSAIENSLYNINFDQDEYVSTNKRNIFDNYYQMVLSFFKKVENNQFKFFGFCEEHDNQIKDIKITINSVDKDILILNFVTIVYKLFISRVQLEALKEEFRIYFNSIDEENVRILFIYNLKKISNHVASLLDFYSFFIEALKGDSMNYEIIKFTLSKTNNFKIKDVFQPQITPENFNVINSINNIFLTEKFATIIMQEDKKNSFITMVFNKKNKNVKDFFDQYLKVIKKNSKSEETFVSNCSLILADNIIYSKKWFDKLEEQEKSFYSALNKFRFEHPNMGQEYLKMKFFAGFNKGNNFF
ncbi:hypothetical protein [Spiroplasma endosymbiont of Atherix ibis]|uniref:hypothetical protein n=1 Tax=Spiroplasma endosymbiont of Atherix ibis TaxID=3066291 RepID=UPI0030CB87B8